MAITIAVANQKGGVGKTTTCVNLTAALRKRGRRVLLLDCDPQGNSTSGMGVDKQTRPNCYDMMINGASAASCIQHRVHHLSHTLVGKCNQPVFQLKRTYLLHLLLKRDYFAFVFQ